MKQYEFEEKIKAYLKRKDWTQARMARALHVQKDTFNKWVRGPNQFPAQELLCFCEELELDETEQAELFDLAGHVLVRPGKTTSFSRLAQEFRLRREFTSREQLQLSTESLTLVEKADFVGVKWTNTFGFAVGLIKADGMSKSQIEEISQGFSRFGDRLYRRPGELKLSFLPWLVGFTMGGVLCFVFEQDCSEEMMTFIGNQKRGSQAYDNEAGILWVQTGATTFSWTVDLKARRIYKQLGKQPNGFNYHAKQMMRELEGLEKTFRDIIGA